MEEGIISCPKCGAKNRVGNPAGDQFPVCGKCKAPLPWIAAANDEDFTDIVSGSLPVVVDFWAEWCAPCRMVAPVLDELAQVMAGRIKVVKLNVDHSPATAGQYRVQNIPTLMIFKRGRPVDSIVGAVSKAALAQRIQPYLAG